MSIRKRMMQDIDRDIADHIAMETQDNIDRGMSPEEARHAALRKFGNVTRVTEDTRSAWGYVWLEQVWQDLRFGARMFFKSPGFTGVAVLTLALGIGANTAIFSLIDAVMLRRLPVNKPEELVILRWKWEGPINHSNQPQFLGWPGCPGENPAGCSFSYPLFQQIHDEKNVFSGVFAFLDSPITRSAKINGQVREASALFVSGDFFSTLGVRPAFGRLLSPTDDTVNSLPVTVLSYGFWQSVFHGDPAVIGKAVLFEKTSYTVIGVTSPEPLQLDPGLATDLWLPLSSQNIMPRTSQNWFWLQIMARLKPGVRTSQAAAIVRSILVNNTTSGPEAIFPASDTISVDLPTAAYGKATLHQAFSKPLYVLLSAVVVILLISCANIAGLMLARNAVRRKEIAVRNALGASPGRIMRQLLTESLLLSLSGGVCGFLLGWRGAQTLANFFGPNLTWLVPMQIDVHPNLRILGFTASTTIFVGVIFGVLPAFLSRRVKVIPALKDGAMQATSGSSRGILGHTLIVAQMALASLLLIGAGLLVRTLSNLNSVPLGFDPQNVLVFSIDSTYSSPKQGNFQTLQEQLASLPGVSSVSSSSGPLIGERSRTYASSIEHPDAHLTANLFWVGPDFFKTMRIPLFAGRALNFHDVEDRQPGQNAVDTPVVISQQLAHKLFGNQAAVGRHFLMGEIDGPPTARRVVVGVVGEARLSGLRDVTLPVIYAPIVYLPVSRIAASFEIRTALNPGMMRSTVQTVVNRFDPNLLITNMKTQVEQIDQNIYQERLIANLSSLFALLALIVACIGIYGLLSYKVMRRTQEIGIRLALGAQRDHVLGIVMRQGAGLAGLGTFIGIGLAIGVTRYLQSFLYGVKPNDPWTIGAVGVLLIGIALLASYIPARRAMRIDPMEALRYE